MDARSASVLAGTIGLLFVFIWVLVQTVEVLREYKARLRRLSPPSAAPPRKLRAPDPEDEAETWKRGTEHEQDEDWWR